MAEITQTTRRRSEWWVALLGGLILGFLFAYNMQPHTVWSLQWLRLERDPNAPLRDWNEYLLVNSAMLLWVPVLALAFLGKGELSQYGLARGDGARGALYALLMYLPMAGLVYFASLRPDFQAYYPLDKRILTDYAYAVYFELVYGYYLFCWEFFFRGFLTFGLYRWLGWWGVGLQAAAFAVMHWGKPVPEIVGAFVAGWVLAWLALRVRSFLPCFWLHWAVSMTLDLILIARHHLG
ncbi:MAG: CPBP family intramembrane metalloprotease [Fimbriimonadales bacterium]|jgi:membrane protease YdiL (CAAX protease family)|nr:CPBP family intramembrane metalloprotease [Fimbriimonadales bacterium]CUU04547.1 CAAX protease self-immunity [Armatimonadetes bacterium GBS]CUU38853.1 CAAX protease self-immunity [Armatimonadetes bacterium GXS]